MNCRYNFYTFYPQFERTQMPMVEGKMPNMDLVHTVNHCAVTCYHAMAEMVKRPDVKNRTKQIQLLHECARICQTQAAFLAMDTPFVKEHAKVCALICEECAKECAKFNDPMSQQCAQTCADCANKCRQFSMM